MEDTYCHDRVYVYKNLTKHLSRSVVFNCVTICGAQVQFNYPAKCPKVTKRLLPFTKGPAQAILQEHRLCLM